MQISAKSLRQIDLGALSGPVLVFGGCYSNLQATQAMQAVAEELGITPEQVICTGDVVAYCADPQPTIDLVRDWGITVVQGNCEQSLADGSADCGCGFDPGSSCSLLSIAWYRYASEQVDQSACRWMAQLPQQVCFSLAGRDFCVVHAGLSSNNRFLFSSTDDAAFTEELQGCDSDVVIGGHCGLPFGRSISLHHPQQEQRLRYWLNSGVIGMPANDGTQQGWYLLLQPDGDRILCQWHRLAYDAQGAAARMLQVGLPEPYAQALIDGLWPSVDVLPSVERQQQGCRLVCPLLTL
ncbi:MAG: metallophosphoesterase family protein [Motiliproteus sp.]